jgi:transposase
MDGFVVLAVDQVDGEWWLLVETTGGVVGCPDCGVRATGHGRSTVQVRDLPNGSGPVRLVWRKRRWRCLDSDCERQTFTERSELVEGALTHRARAEICRAVGEDGHTVAEQARRFGIGWSTAMTAVRDHGRPLVEDRQRLHRVRTLGVDEHKMLAAGPKHHTVFATQLVDLERARLLDVVPGRSAKSVRVWLDERTRSAASATTIIRLALASKLVNGNRVSPESFRRSMCCSTWAWARMVTSRSRGSPSWSV